MGLSNPSAGSQLRGTTTNDNAAAGNVGEFISSDIASGSAVALTAGVPANITSISLTAGDWDVWVVGQFTGGATTTVTALEVGVSATSATFDQTLGRQALQAYNSFAVFTVASPVTIVTGTRFSLAATTTIFFVAEAVFAVNTCSGYGTLMARRRR
jgi:hypothetical protein